MVFAKFSNPHEVFSTQVVKIDRAQLSADSEGDAECSGLSDAAEEMDAAGPKDDEDESRVQLQQALDQMLGSSLDLGSAPSKGDRPEDGVDKVAKKKKKAKKKKVDSNPVFRLLPGPPHRISLLEPLHKGHPLIRPAEDTEEQARERADRIASSGVVVELGDVVKDGSAHWPLKPGSKQGVPTYRIENSVDPNTTEGLPTFLVLDQNGPGGIQELEADIMNDRMQQSLVTCCPVVYAIPSSTAIRSTQSEAQPAAKPPRIRSRKTAAHPPPAFFRPNQEWGGSSAGYAYGYPSSKPFAKSGRFHGGAPNTKYFRDKMQKAKHPEIATLWDVPDKKAFLQGTGKRTVWTTEDGIRVEDGSRVVQRGSKRKRKE